MARRLRVEEEGGLYHVLNRGNYRQWIFREDGAKLAFEATLLEACARVDWVLHAFCIMGNHYHLALETRGANLSEGMRWLQSVFATRFNRYRKERGHLFQGRFKSLMVEDSARLAAVCHYIHLNPVRAGICGVSQLADYRWSSCWYLNRARPAGLELRTCLEGAGGLKDTRAGRKSYERYLAWLQEDRPAQKQLEFAKMSRGWVLGTKAFRREMVQAEKRERPRLRLSREAAAELREARAEAHVDRCLQVMGKGPAAIGSEAKAAAWKVAIAAHLRARLLATNGWIAARLHMGSRLRSVVTWANCSGTNGRRPSTSCSA
jgi:REP element-mobilizing transposase RayT